jgi:hypothetical protein
MAILRRQEPRFIFVSNSLGDPLDIARPASLCNEFPIAIGYNLLVGPLAAFFAGLDPDGMNVSSKTWQANSSGQNRRLENAGEKRQQLRDDEMVCFWRVGSLRRRQQSFVGCYGGGNRRGSLPAGGRQRDRLFA